MNIFGLVIMTQEKLMVEQSKCFNKGWDIERVDSSIDWLRHNFEVK